MTENITIERLVEHVSLLDRLGGSDEFISWNGDEYTADYLQRTVATQLAAIVGAHHGTGSWAASNALRKLTQSEVKVLLMAYGATTFTVEQHAARVHGIIRSGAAKGGA